MTKLLIMAGVVLGGGVGWWLGAHVGLMTAFLLSGVGNVVGIWVGWRVAQMLSE